jgi:hypothetical protein
VNIRESAKVGHRLLGQDLTFLQNLCKVFRPELKTKKKIDFHLFIPTLPIPSPAQL